MVKAWLVQYRKEHLAKHMGGQYVHANSSNVCKSLFKFELLEAQIKLLCGAGIDRGDAKELKCPFGFSSSIRTSIQEKKERVKILYEVGQCLESGLHMPMIIIPAHCMSQILSVAIPQYVSALTCASKSRITYILQTSERCGHRQ